MNPARIGLGGHISTEDPDLPIPRCNHSVPSRGGGAHEALLGVMEPVAARRHPVRIRASKWPGCGVAPACVGLGRRASRSPVPSPTLDSRRALATLPSLRAALNPPPASFGIDAVRA